MGRMKAFCVKHLAEGHIGICQASRHDRLINGVTVGLRHPLLPLHTDF